MSWHCSDQWIAGFFDGEGCVTIMRRQRKGYTQVYVAVQIAQLDKRPLVAMQRRYGGCLTSCMRKGKPFWYLRWHTAQAQRFLRAMLPLVLLKKPEVKMALELGALIGLPGHRVPSGVLKKKLAIWRKFRRYREIQNSVASKSEVY